MVKKKTPTKNKVVRVKAAAKTPAKSATASSHSYKTIKRFDVLSVAVIYCLIMAVVAIIIGLVNGVISLIGGASLGPVLLSIVILLVLYAILGFVFGALGAWIYNCVAKKVRGIKVVLE